MTKGQKINFLANMMDKTRKMGEKKKMVEACGLTEGKNPKTVMRSLWFKRAFDRNVLEHVDKIAEYFGCDVMEMCKPAPQDMLDELDHRETVWANRVERGNADRRKNTCEEGKILNSGGMLPRRMSETQKQWEKCKRGAMSLCFFCDNTHRFRCELFHKDGKPPKEAKYTLSYEVTYDGNTMLPRYLVTECKNFIKDRHIKEKLL